MATDVFTLDAYVGLCAWIDQPERPIEAEVGLGATVNSTLDLIRGSAGLTATITGTVLPFLHITETVTDSLFLYEDIGIEWRVRNNDSLVLADTPSAVLGLLISDWLTLTDTQANNWNGREIVNESLTLWDTIVDSRHYTKTIDESLVLTDSTSLKLTVTILDLLWFTDLAAAMKTCAEIVNDGMVLTDQTDRGFNLAVTSLLSVIDTNSVVATFLNSVSSSLGITDSSSASKRLGLTVSESIVFTETISSQGTFYSTVYDTLHMNVMVEISGEVWECYVLNTPEFHPSMYSGFDFNSFCVFEGRAFGANDTGIYELTGATDAGATIHTGAILSQTNFGSPNQKRFRRGYLGVSGSAPVMVLETETGEREIYAINTEGKVTASSDLKSKKWTLSIADFDTLQTMKLIPVILTK